MTCKPCIHDPDTGLGNDLELQQVIADSSVPCGDMWKIYVDVYNNSWVKGDKGKICVYDGENVIAETGTFYLGPDKIVRETLSGIMPDRNLYLNVSLVKEWGPFTRCEDGRSIVIMEGPTDLAHPADPPYDPDEDKDLGAWIMDNLVLILVLTLIIIILLKFG